MIYSEADKSCCFTGHRELPSYLYGAISEQVDAEIKRLYDLGVRRFIAGGALGFDTLCAERVLDAKKKLDGITLMLALPCREHDKRWSWQDKIRFSDILSKADDAVYVSEEYTRYCMFKRNRFMVDNSLYCVSYCTEKSGGTYYTVNYAKSLFRKITELSERVRQ